MISIMRNSLFALVVLFCVIFGKINCESNQPQIISNENDSENEFNSKIARLLEEANTENNENDLSDNSYVYSDIPNWKLYLLKRALPRMGKRAYYLPEDSLYDDGSSSDEIEVNDKRALPRMGRALPRMGRALPRMGRALPRLGRTLPRMG